MNSANRRPPDDHSLPNQQQQQQPIGDLSNNDNDLQHHPLDQQFSSLSSMAINESEDDDDKSYSEPFRGTNVIVKLSDCMECYIRISRCQIEKQDHSTNTDTQTELPKQEQQDNHGNVENSVPKQQHQTSSTVHEDEVADNK